MSDLEQICRILSSAHVVYSVVTSEHGSMLSIVGAECCRLRTCDTETHANLGDDQLKTVMLFDQLGKLTSVGTYDV